MMEADIKDYEIAVRLIEKAISLLKDELVYISCINTAVDAVSTISKANEMKGFLLSNKLEDIIGKENNEKIKNAVKQDKGLLIFTPGVTEPLSELLEENNFSIKKDFSYKLGGGAAMAVGYSRIPFETYVQVNYLTPIIKKILKKQFTKNVTFVSHKEILDRNKITSQKEYLHFILQFPKTNSEITRIVIDDEPEGKESNMYPIISDKIIEIAKNSKKEPFIYYAGLQYLQKDFETIDATIDSIEKALKYSNLKLEFSCINEPIVARRIIEKLSKIKGKENLLISMSDEDAKLLLDAVNINYNIDKPRGFVDTACFFLDKFNTDIILHRREGTLYMQKKPASIEQAISAKLACLGSNFGGALRYRDEVVKINVENIGGLEIYEPAKVWERNLNKIIKNIPDKFAVFVPSLKCNYGKQCSTGTGESSAFTSYVFQSCAEKVLGS